MRREHANMAQLSLMKNIPILVAFLLICVFFYVLLMDGRTKLNIVNVGPGAISSQLCKKSECVPKKDCLCYINSSTCIIDNYSSLEDSFDISLMDIEKVKGIKCAMTINAIGRLGNLMGEYATLYALAQLNDRPAFILKKMAKVLQKYFKISLPILNETVVKELENQKLKTKQIRLHDWMEPSYSNFEGFFIRLTGYPASWTFYHHIRQEILKEFTFRDHIVLAAQSKLRALRAGRTSVTYVGIHVRRTDYVKLMKTAKYKGVVADAGFLANATDYFREKYADAIFVVASDDLDWCVKNINNSRKDVYFVGNNDIKDPIWDLAILANCNHSIITIGTYGYWSAYLAGGEVVYLHNYTLPDSHFLKVMKYNSSYLPEWIPVNANLLNNTKTES